MSGMGSAENHELTVRGMVVGLNAQRGCGDSIGSTSASCRYYGISAIVLCLRMLSAIEPSHRRRNGGGRVQISRDQHRARVAGMETPAFYFRHYASCLYYLTSFIWWWRCFYSRR